jgi:putative serine/threonine protein kinase
VAAVEFSGSACLFGVGLPVLGKGFVGIAVIAYVGGNRVALKIRRMDADRADLLHEAEMLKVANAVDVGPKLFGASKNFLVMQLIDGCFLSEWLETHREKLAVRKVLVDVLEQCWRLDEAGLDHGELSKAPKHLMVNGDGKPFIIDFETSSTDRRVANVTAVCQYLFAGNSSASRVLAEILEERDSGKLLEALRAYKKDGSRSNFESLVGTCLS